jgi:hypothetical protein
MRLVRILKSSILRRVYFSPCSANRCLTRFFRYTQFVPFLLANGNFLKRHGHGSIGSSTLSSKLLTTPVDSLQGNQVLSDSLTLNDG